MSSPLPDVNLTIGDGALGIVPESTDNIVLHVGVCSAGSANVIYSFTDKKTLQATLGTGPLVDSAALSLDTAGGPVYCCRITATTAGSVGSVTHTGTGTAVLTESGAPLDAYVVQVQILTAGTNLAAGTASFKYTLDGGTSWSPAIAVPTGGTYAIPGTGMSITWADGTFVANDVYSFAATAPSYALTDLQATMTAVLADPRTWSAVHVVGPAATVAASAAMAAALDTIMSSAETSFRYAFAIIAVADDTDANIIAGFVNTSSKRVMACAGYAMLQSTISGLVRKRSSSWLAAARVAQVPIHEHLGRVKTGPVKGIVSLLRDEQATPGLDAQRFTTLRTIIGEQGYWLTAGKMLAPAGSDFSRVEYRRVMDRTCTVARAAYLEFLNDSLTLQSDTDQTPGAVTEKQARSLEGYVNSELASAMTGHVSKAYTLVDRTHNVTSDSKLPVKVRVQPLGYATEIDVDIAFENPALAAK